MNTMASEKRPGEDLQSTKKKTKTGGSSTTLQAIAIHATLAAIPVRKIDDYITKGSSDNGICNTIEDLKLIEARFTSPLTQPFVEYQRRLLLAQWQYQEQLLKYAYDQQAIFHKKMTTENAALQSARLVVLAQTDEVKSRPTLQDAIYYRATFMLFYAAFACSSGANPKAATKEFTQVIEKADLEMEIPAFAEMLVSASERHLERKEDRSAIWVEYLPQVQDTIPPTITSSQFGNAVGPNLQQPDTDNWVAIKAQSFIKSWEELDQYSNLTAWDKIDNVSEQDKLILRKERGLRRARPNEQHDTPPGILLHGPQGSGKTAFVNNWCKHIKGTLIEFASQAKGKYEGQTEQLLSLLFEKAINIGRTTPVVLFLDEAEQLLTGGIEDRAGAIQALIKALFTKLESSKSEVYFFATTNTPGKLRWTEGWGRRLQLKFHVRLPSTQGRCAIMMHRLASSVPDITEDRVLECAKMLEGYSASDIGRLAREFRKSSDNDVFVTQYWREVQKEASSVLVPATQGGIGVIACHFDNLSDEDVQRVELSQLKMADLELYVTSCLQDPRTRTVTAEEVEQHENWASQYKST